MWYVYSTGRWGRALYELVLAVGAWYFCGWLAALFVLAACYDWPH